MFFRLFSGWDLFQGPLEPSGLLGRSGSYTCSASQAARFFILRALQPELDAITGSKAESINWDYKSRLQEWSHKHHEEVPLYRIVAESGPDHRKSFEVEVLVKGQALGCGRGKTKKEAEQSAARQALERA